MTKKYLYAILFVSLSSVSLAQSMEFDLPVLLNRSSYGVKEGEVVNIKSIFFDQFGDLKVEVEKSGNDHILPSSVLKHIIPQEPRSLYEFWQQEFLINHAYDAYAFSSDFQFDIRRELDELSNDAIKYYDANDLFIRDLYVESYLHELVYELYPSDIKPGLPGNVRVRILKNTFPSAKIYPNGFIIINSGLLALLRSELELKSIIAHELAHYVLEHPLNRLKELKKRKARAEFWSGVATFAAAAIDVSTASRGRNYAPGMLTYSTAVISSAIADKIEYQVGIKYSHEQEYEADKVAVSLLEFLGYNSDPLFTVLSRLEEYFYYHGFYESLINSETHPNLSFRQKQIGGEMHTSQDENYLRTISEVISINGDIEFYNYHYRSALEMYEVNILNHLGSSTDYLNAAQSLIYLYDDTESNVLAMSYLDSIGSFTESDVLIAEKVAGIVHYRLGNSDLAIKSIERYISKLQMLIDDTTFTFGQPEVINWCRDEIGWSRRLIAKWDR
jgi:Zn-dependent protease with chaperone function